MDKVARLEQKLSVSDDKRHELEITLRMLVHRCEQERVGTAWAVLHDAKQVLQRVGVKV